MIALRFLVIFLVIIFYDKIFNFLKHNNIETPNKLKKTIIKKVSNITNSIVNNDFEESLKIIKKVDKKTYKKCLVILKNINIIKNDLIDNKYIDFKNEYKNINFNKMELLNLVGSMVVNKGFFKEHPNIMKITEKYLKDIIAELIDIAEKKNYNVNWFEDSIYDIEANDIYSPDYSPNYSLF